MVEVQDENDEDNGNDENCEEPSNLIKYYKTVVSEFFRTPSSNGLLDLTSRVKEHVKRLLNAKKQ